MHRAGPIRAPLRSCLSLLLVHIRGFLPVPNIPPGRAQRVIDCRPPSSALARVRSVVVALQRARRLLLPVVLISALAIFAMRVHPESPVHRWFFWRYPVYWMIAAAWSACCFSAGHAVLKRVLRSPLPLMEHFAMCFAVGTLAFFLLMYAGGLAMAYGPVFFVALPIAMLGVGGWDAFVYLRRLLRHLVYARAHDARSRATGGAFLWLVGIITVFLYYLPSVVPSHIGYDSAWYHVPLGEHYARLGGIRPLVEGWYPGAIAHLPSILYCWAFLLPRGTLFDYIELASHLEFFTLLMMLPGIPALARRLVPGARAHVSWIAFFAFPSLWWYDLLIGADQISALWCAPITLALLRAYPSLSWRHGLVLAMAVSGASLTKFSSSGIILLPALAIPLRACWLCVRRLREGASIRSALWTCRGAALTGLAVGILTTPLWAKNWVWYGDPFFPLLHRHFRDHPFTRDAAVYVAEFLNSIKSYQPPTGWAGVRASLAATVDHSFQPTDFSTAPYRGSLFTLSCLCLPFVRAKKRLWAVALLGNVAIFGWFWQLHQDRYLLAFMPVMAAVIAAVTILAWRSSLAARAAVTALIVLHTIWGLGVFALDDVLGHYRGVLDFISAATRDRSHAGMDAFAPWQAVDKAVPKNSKVLVHVMHLKAGIGHPTVSDWPLMQTGIDYGRMTSAAAMHRQLRSMGITHIVWNSTNWADDSIAGDLRFYEYVAKYANPREIAGVILGTVPDAAPPEEANEPFIAFFGCNDHYKAGLYRFSQMAVPNPRRQSHPPYPDPIEEFTGETDVDAAVSSAKFVLHTANCGWASPSTFATAFQKIGERDQHAIYMRL
jgi:hypothetical protein